MQNGAETETWRLLRVLLLRDSQVSTRSKERWVLRCEAGRLSVSFSYW